MVLNSTETIRLIRDGEMGGGREASSDILAIFIYRPQHWRNSHFVLSGGDSVAIGV